MGFVLSPLPLPEVPVLIARVVRFVRLNRKTCRDPLELPLPDADPAARFDDVESKATRLPSADTDVLLDPWEAADPPPPLLLLLPQLGTITAAARSNPHVAQAGRRPFRFVL